MDYREIIEHFANPMLDHSEDLDKCGLCLKQSITASVARRYLEANRTSAEDFNALQAEADALWRETALYKRVKDLMRQGLGIDEISDLLSQEGIDI